MRLNSFIEVNGQWLPVEVELELWPGLPDIHFLGRADSHLKESAKRIKSAIKAQGFEFPVTQQILVNLRPSHVKKTSRGLELAVAVAYLLATEQIKLNSEDKIFYFGELTLKGEVLCPEGSFQLPIPQGESLLTGPNTGPQFIFDSCRVKELKDLKNFIDGFIKIKGQLDQICWAPDQKILNLKVTKPWAQFLSVTALGRHSALIAGSAGGGKTTASRILHALMEPPNQEEKIKIIQKNFDSKQSHFWRPLINPHHTTPRHSLIGGGNQAHGGEIVKAHLGALVFDEFFEFAPEVLESLREPMETGVWTVSRGGQSQSYPLNTQFVATTNLCPCGDFVPGGNVHHHCRFTQARCRSYSQKISGPLVDRFEILYLLPPRKAQNNNLEQLEVENIRLEVEDKRNWAQNKTIDTSRFEFYLSQDALLSTSSHRRKIATLKVAKSLAILDGQTKLDNSHIHGALELTLTSFDRLKRWDLGGR